LIDAWKNVVKVSARYGASSLRSHIGISPGAASLWVLKLLKNFRTPFK
jgi:hypothetical protein